MDRFRKSFSLRKKKENESSKPELWVEDQMKIKEGSCSFQVKYLGCIEVFESRGMQVCEEAIKALRKSKKKVQRAILYVSGDALRVSDEISKHLIVDQTIEKVSFCAPDRGHDKGFAYICRDGATRRWMCHAFLAIKESGERLSHAVGCAFAICLEKKQKRERDAVHSNCANDEATFLRVSSFNKTSLSERLLDPQSAIVVDHNADMTTKFQTSSAVAESGAIVPFGCNMDKLFPSTKLGSGAIPRPRASSSLIERQTSLRLFPKLQETSPFKHSLSLRIADENVPTLHLSNQIARSETIPEESPADAGVQPSMLTPFSSADAATFNTPDPCNAFVLPEKQPNSSVAFPVTFEPFKNSDAETEAIEVGDTSSGLLVDPFSAAPFNPATIQQHRVAQQQLENQAILSTKEAASLTTTMPPWALLPTEVTPPTHVTTKAPSFPVSDWPTVANGSSKVGGLFAPSPFPTSVTAAAGFNLPAEQQPSFADENAAVRLFGADITKVASTFKSGKQWVPALLPLESANFTEDPFDLTWAERATEIAKGQLSDCAPTLAVYQGAFPFPANHSSSSNITADLSVSTNPFLNPLPNI